jgi:hypothetical protein
MLNPSIADASINDATIRRVIGFTEQWAHTRATVVNLYAFRATEPDDLRQHIRVYGEADAVGERNDAYLRTEILEADTVICAWGAPLWATAQADAVTALIRKLGKNPMCLGHTLSRAPKHPLYLGKYTPLIPL